MKLVLIRIRPRSGNCLPGAERRATTLFPAHFRGSSLDRSKKSRPDLIGPAGNGVLSRYSLIAESSV